MQSKAACVTGRKSLPERKERKGRVVCCVLCVVCVGGGEDKEITACLQCTCDDCPPGCRKISHAAVRCVAFGRDAQRCGNEDNISTAHLIFGLDCVGRECGCIRPSATRRGSKTGRGSSRLSRACSRKLSSAALKPFKSIQRIIDSGISILLL